MYSHPEIRASIMHSQTQQIQWDIIQISVQPLQDVAPHSKFMYHLKFYPLVSTSSYPIHGFARLLDGMTQILLLCNNLKQSGHTHSLYHATGRVKTIILHHFHSELQMFSPFIILYHYHIFQDLRYSTILTMSYINVCACTYQYTF